MKNVMYRGIVKFTNEAGAFLGSHMTQVGQADELKAQDEAFELEAIIRKNGIYSKHARVEVLSMLETDIPRMTVKPVGSDDWGRKLFQNDATGVIYAEVDGRLHTRTKDGEPIASVSNILIIHYKHQNGEMMADPRRVLPLNGYRMRELSELLFGERDSALIGKEGNTFEVEARFLQDLPGFDTKHQTIVDQLKGKVLLRILSGDADYARAQAVEVGASV